MVTVTLYNNTSDSNVLSKTITQVATLQCALKDATELMNPVLIIAGDTIETNVNYVYIPDLERYYFVRNKRQVTANRLELDLHVDVLMSFPDVIANSQGYVLNSASKPWEYIDSPNWVRDLRQRTDTVEFANGFNESPEYILMTVGGGGIGV